MVSCNELYKLIENLKTNIEYIDKYKELINLYKDDINKINLVFYDLYQFEYNENSEINKSLKDNRDGQEEFRNNLINLDKHCIISGDDPELCQACHIIPLCDSKSYNINNGILLNYNFHNMFDNYYISFRFNKNINEKYDNYEVILSNKIKNKPSYKNYKSYDNKSVQIRNECRNNLQKKYDEFIKKELM
jgi:hypothetical protein